MSSAIAPRVRYLVHRHRRLIAALSAALAVVISIGILRPPAPDVVDVMVAATDLAPGTTLTPDALTAVAVPADLVPAGTALSSDDLVGRMLATGIDAGEPLTATRLVAGAGSASLLPGEVAVPVRLADAALAGLIGPGEFVDIVSAREAGVSVIAEAARVVTVPRRESRGILDSSTGEPASLLLVATDRRTAAALAAAGLRGPLAAIVTSPGG